jgi:hypothetical protein
MQVGFQSQSEKSGMTQIVVFCDGLKATSQIVSGLTHLTSRIFSRSIAGGLFFREDSQTGILLFAASQLHPPLSV